MKRKINMSVYQQPYLNLCLCCIGWEPGNSLKYYKKKKKKGKFLERQTSQYKCKLQRVIHF